MTMPPVSWIALVVFSVLFSYLAYREPKWGIFAILLLLPSYLIRFSVLGIPFTVLEVMILLAAVTFILKNRDFRQLANAIYIVSGKIRRYRWPILLFLVAATTSIFVSPDTTAALGIWKAYFVEAIVFFVLFLAIIHDGKDARMMVSALGLSLAAVSMLAIYQKITGWGIPNAFWQAEETRRVTSFFGYPNAIGLFAAPIVVLFAGRVLALVTKARKRGLADLILSLGVIILGVLAIVFAVSKGAMIAVTAGIAVLLLVHSRKTRALLAGLAVISVIALALPSVHRPIIQRIGPDSISTTVRTEMWGETVAMLATRPILGAGLAGYQQAVEPFHEKFHVEIYLYPHNVLLNFWTEVGLAGTIAFFWIIIAFFGFAIPNRKKPTAALSNAALAAMVAILVHGLVDVPYLKNDLAVLFWAIIGLGATEA